MANKEHVSIIKQGFKTWNKWREENPKITPNLSRAKLNNVRLQHSNLERANLRNAELKSSFLMNADLSNANLEGANLSSAYLTDADLSGANLRHARLLYSHLPATNLEAADLRGADLTGASFYESKLTGARFYGAIMGISEFANIDLSDADGLDNVVHSGPSTIGIDTLYKSGGRIPENFLRGCGVPDDFITFVPSHFTVPHAIQFYSCFISYSHKDEEFARRLFSRMRDEHLRVWFAPEEMKGGEKLHEQIECAIQLYDRLLLVLSEDSMESEWVMTEIRNARSIEIEDKRRKLFPIRLVGFDKIKKWKCFDAESGKDLAVEAREYFIPDFSHWKDHDAFEEAFGRLLRDLKAQQTS